MKLYEKVEEILDNYIVMKQLTDDKIYEVVLRKLPSCFFLHRNKSGVVYEITVDEEMNLITIDRDGIYIERELAREMFKNGKVVQTQQTTPIYNVHGKIEMYTPSSPKIRWTLESAADFEKFIQSVDKII